MKKLISSLTIIFTLFIVVGCSQTQATDQKEDPTNSNSEITAAFKGEKGEFVTLENNKITLKADDINDGQAHYYNTTLPDNSPVYFFVVKSPDGKLRAAANGCQVCGRALQGFHQEEETMVCNTCGNSYPLNKIATEKGGCNPAPINPDLEINDGLVTITLSELEEIKQFFN